jgi:hypothetical protein
MREPGWADVRATGRDEFENAWHDSPEFLRMNEVTRMHCPLSGYTPAVCVIGEEM